MLFAIPNHPWVDSSDGAAVRIAMTVGRMDVAEGTLLSVTQEKPAEGDGATEVTFRTQQGRIHADLSCGANVTEAKPLVANAGVCFQGMNLVGEGFRVDAEAIQTMGFDVNAKRRSSNGLLPLPPVIRRYQKGRELVQGGNSGWVLDCFGLTEEELQRQYPSVFQHLYDHVKPDRDHNNRPSYRNKWWIFGEPRGRLRKAFAGLSRYIGTLETAKFKLFVFLPPDVVPDHKLYAVASDDAFVLGVLSSRIHSVWALAAGGRLGVGNDPTWTNTTTFSPFPFPDATPEQTARVRELGEELDKHRKSQQNLHSSLTLTGMYNVLERLRKNETLTDEQRTVHQQGVLTVLRRIHDDLDAAVANAYGWLDDPCDQEILVRLTALNAARKNEEEGGTVRWLRPSLQNPDAVSEQQTEIALVSESRKKNTGGKSVEAVRPWPKKLPNRMLELHKALAASSGPVTSAFLAAKFAGASPAKVGELLDAFCVLGQARQLESARYVSQTFHP